MSSNRAREFRFWQSVAMRWLVIVFLGWLMILWFQGCLVPNTRDEMRLNQQKAADSTTPPDSR